MNDAQKVYLVLAIIWLVVILCISTYITDIACILILLIPFIVFAINAYTDCPGNHEDYVAEAGLYSSQGIGVSVLILAAVFVWLDRDYEENSSIFIGLIILAITFSLLSHIIVWVPARYLGLISRIKTGLNTMSVSLIIFVFYLYYQHRSERQFKVPKDLWDGVFIN